MKIILEHATEILLLLFMSITFLQSGLDKITDWSGNISWLKDHFAKTPLKNIVPFMVGTVLITEVVAGFLCLAGIYLLVSENDATIGFYGAVLACVTLLMLLFGQRVAKDYEGAKTIAVYFIPAIFLVFLLQ
ncbi:DoxX family protein [Maribacter confluentis]|uniref:DoxX family protein n=1 Tax=Maribacter confluentis TaxID=1656093 RepID=A0ABT8RPS8_9FLAO|nr:DoxX family protein [Maribacter confluentis]MDO1512921.1 DoxX family protein [Maribacter confluentis]